MITLHKLSFRAVNLSIKVGVTLTALGIVSSQAWTFLTATATTINPSKVVPARWLQVRELRGLVTVQLAKRPPRPARTGDRLAQVGEQIMTGVKAEAVLSLDQSTAIIRMVENTVVQVQKLKIDSKGGYITVLSVPKGLARLQVRPFTRPSSQLDIQTPAGVAGVRGTSYGVVVNPNGKTTVATQFGAVAVSGQAQTEMIKAGQYTLVVPGQPPLPPQTLTSDLSLTVQSLTPAVDTQQKVRQVQVEGKVDPANAVWFNGELVNTNTLGEFKEITPVPENQWIAISVRNPFGAERLYQFYIPPQPYVAPIKLGTSASPL